MAERIMLPQPPSTVWNDTDGGEIQVQVNRDKYGSTLTITVYVPNDEGGMTPAARFKVPDSDLADLLYGGWFSVDMEVPSK